MEENTVRVNEIEEIEPDVDPEVEGEEAIESSNGGAVVAGVVGGFLAYAAISGAKRLAAFIAKKWAERKQKEMATHDVVDADFTEIPDEQADSEEEATEEE